MIMKKRIKIVFTGHSIVNGYPFSRKYSFPDIAGSLLPENYTVINRGVNGESTADILFRFRQDVIEEEPDAVFIMAGTNDFIYRTATPKDAVRDCRRMFDLAKAAGIETVFMTSPHVNIVQASESWPATTAEDYARVQAEIKEYNGLLADLSAAEGISLLDVYGEYQNYGRFQDGIHPTAEGQRLIAEMCVRQILRMFASE